jgi:NAD(P)-dependent dehydrogenase (short-subunit alcohol dehydrogenase family)
MLDGKSDGGKGRLLAAGLGLGLVAREVVQRLREADLRDEVALITGGSRGLGLLLARELAKEGCRLVICARDQGELRRAREDLEARGAQVLDVSCDVADRAQVDRMIEQATSRFGGVDTVINNAGIIQVGPIQTMTLEDFEQAMGVIFWGMVYPTMALLPGMLERRSGRIVNITSIGGKVSVPHLVPYNCAKFATVGFSEGLGAELAGTGVQVTTIVPGLMRTGSHLNAVAKGNQEAEFGLFALAASLPIVSMDGERAARQIVQAVKRGQKERILSIPANVMARIQGLLPGANTQLLGLVNRFVMPAPDGAGAASGLGRDIQARMSSRLLDSATRWGRSAAERFHQYPGPSPASAPEKPPGG